MSSSSIPTKPSDSTTIYLAQIKSFIIEYMKIGVKWDQISVHTDKLVKAYRKLLTDTDIDQLKIFLKEIRKRPPKVKIAKTATTVIKEADLVEDFEKSFTSDPESFLAFRKNIAEHKIDVHDLNFKSYYKEAFGLPSSVYKYPLIWSIYQEDEINHIYASYQPNMNEEESSEALKVFNDLKADKFPTYLQFIVALMIRAFKGNALLYPNERIEFKTASKSALFGENEEFYGTSMKMIKVMALKIRMVCLGGKRKEIDGKEKYFPLLIYNEDWKPKSASLMKELFENMITNNFESLILWLDDIKDREPLEDIPFANYFLKMPDFRFNFGDMPWYFLANNLHDGIYYPQNMERGELNWRMSYHELNVFLVSLYGYDLALEIVLHHEFLHHIEYTYNALADFLDLFDSTPDKFSEEQRKKIIKYRPIYEEAKRRWFVHSDDPTKEIRFRGIKQSLKNVFDQLVERYHITEKKRVQYTNRFQGHDYAFVLAVKEFASDKGSCLDALRQKAEMMYFHRVMYYKIFNRNFISGAWMTCSPDADEVLPSESASSERY